MEDLKFNTNAFIKPQTPAESDALLDEALLLADELIGHLAAFGATLTIRRAMRVSQVSA